MRGRVWGPLAIAIALASMTAGGIVITTNNGGGPATGTGNVWVDTNGGTCTYSATAVAYNDAAACSSFQTAYAAVDNTGDTICVKSGSYSTQTVTYIAGKTTPNTVIQGCEATEPVVAAMVVGNCNGSNQPRAVTFKNMAINGSVSQRAVFVCYGSTDPTTRATDVTFDNVDVAVGKGTNGPVFEVIGGTLRLTIKNSQFGPACCGNNASGVETGSPVGIRIGTANRVSGGWPTNTDTVIENNTIKGITHLCSEWLTGYGSCPSTNCSNLNELCHEDGIQVYGSTGIIIRKNKIYHVGINGIFIDSTDPNVDGTLENNMIGDVMRGATCFDIDGRNLLGTWNAVNNTCSIAGGDGYYITWARTMDTNNMTWNWKGNTGPIYISNVPSADSVPGVAPVTNCTGDAVGVFTRSYNTVSTANSSPVGCGGNETIGDPTFVNTALAPTDTMDLHLFGINSFADNKIPAAFCSSFVTTDIDNDNRPLNAGFCDAGADERNQ